MNYLGHALLSFGNPDIIAGNLMGDFFKGVAVLETLPSEIKKGALLHRFIDGYCDVHPAMKRVKILFRADYGLYSGAILDTINDHFLANDPHYFPDTESLRDFAATVYTALENRQQ